MRDNTALINEVIERIPNKYMAVIVASKRAKAINDGKRPLVRVGTGKHITAALAEIAEGAIVPGTEAPEIEAAEEIVASESGDMETEEEEEEQLLTSSDNWDTDETEEDDETDEEE